MAPDVSSFRADLMRTLSPRADARHGPLPLMLVGLTVVTGLVDAFSYLLLGHVFVANMTGNVVFLGFALAGAPGFSVAASLVALAAFWFGALCGGFIGSRISAHRAKLLSAATAIQALLFAAALGLAAVNTAPISAGYRYPLVALLAVGMGIQNATARKLAVPDLTTPVLTLTSTGTAADSALVGGKGSAAVRRTISVLSMFVGALVGALLVIHVRIFLPLVIALCILNGVGTSALVLGRSDPGWVTP